MPGRTSRGIERMFSWSSLIGLVMVATATSSLGRAPYSIGEVTTLEPEGAPYWTNPEVMKKTVHRLYAGITAKLHCPAGGNPTPSMRWLKNGKEVKQEHRNEGFKVRRQKWSLIIKRVVPTDSGNYTCILENKYGSINHTYHLDYIEICYYPRPVLQRGLPANMTITVGENAEFVCKVHIYLEVLIKWLKHIEVNGSKYGPDGLPYLKELRQLTKSNLKPGAKVTDVLYVHNVSFEDAGEYTCLAGNSIGISRHSAWLTVLPEYGPITCFEEDSSLSEFEPWQSVAEPWQSVQIAIICVAFFLVSCTLLIVLAYHMKSSTKKPEINSSLAAHKPAKDLPPYKQALADLKNFLNSNWPLVKITTYLSSNSNNNNNNNNNSNNSPMLHM